MLNPWILLGLVAAFLATNAYTAYRAYDYAASQCESAKWESQVKALNQQLATQKIAADSAAAERQKIEQRNSELETQVADYESKLESIPAEGAPEAVCDFRDPAAAARLRNIR